MKCFAPIRNLSCDANMLDLQNGLAVVKLDDREIMKRKQLFLKYHVVLPNQMNIDDALPKGFYLETNIDRTAFSDWIERITGAFENVIKALIIFQKHPVWFDVIYTVNPPGVATSHPKSSFETAMDIPGYQCELTGKVLVEFREFWERFSEAIKNRSIALAADRFNQGRGRHKVDDRLLDYIISFECLFSDGPPEVSYKLARRIAVLLEKKHWSRKNTFKKLKKIYVLRSDVVHGRKIDYKKIAKTNVQAESYLRHCLNRIVSGEQYDKKDLLAKLDFGGREG